MSVNNGAADSERLTPDDEPHLSPEELRANIDDKLDVVIVDLRKVSYRTTILAEQIAGVELTARERGHELKNSLSTLTVELGAVRAVLESITDRQDAQEDLHVQRHRFLLDRLGGYEPEIPKSPPPATKLPVTTRYTVIFVLAAAALASLLTYLIMR